MIIDIIVGVIASLIVFGLFFYFIWHGKRQKGCNCATVKKYKRDLKKAKKEILKK